MVRSAPLLAFQLDSPPTPSPWPCRAAFSFPLLIFISPSVHRYVKTFATATRNYAKRQLQWYRKDGAFLWLKIDRRAGGVGDLAPYRAVCAEITHWCSQPEDCFRLALRQQVRCAWAMCMCVWGG